MLYNKVSYISNVSSAVTAIDGCVSGLTPHIKPIVIIADIPLSMFLSPLFPPIFKLILSENGDLSICYVVGPASHLELPYKLIGF